MAITKLPVFKVEATAADKSVQLTLSTDPCNLKVLVAPLERGQLTKLPNVSPVILMEDAAVTLKSSKPTQLTFGAKADAVAGSSSIVFAIKYVECIANCVLTAIGLCNSLAVKKQFGDSMASNTPSLSSSKSTMSFIASLSVSAQAFIEEIKAKEL